MQGSAEREGRPAGESEPSGKASRAGGQPAGRRAEREGAEREVQPVALYFPTAGLDVWQFVINPCSNELFEQT